MRFDGDGIIDHGESVKDTESPGSLWQGPKLYFNYNAIF